MNVIENNKIIAEFMGLTQTEENYFYHPQSERAFRLGDLKYNSDWNWLMEVVERIEGLTNIDTNGCSMELESVGFNAKFILEDGTRMFKDCKGETKIEAVYLAVVEFIKSQN